MIDIKDKSLCCGCSACVQICPKECIFLWTDHEGFLYPRVDKKLCINCGLCEKVCHETQPYQERLPLNVYAANNKDTGIRLKSSSGGIFTILAEGVIRKGGVAFGARFDEDWQVILDYTETFAGLEKFRGSKYVQARTGNTYSKAESFLKQGRLVLFSGTPCQIAGLNHYLRKQYNNLLTVDFVCHGVPSPKVWGRYLDEVIGAANKSIHDIEFRNKYNGWKKFNFVLDYNQDDKTVHMSSYHGDNHYMRAFLSNMILRPSCYHCKAKSGRSHSDITIADYWGIQHLHPQMDDDKGTGLVFLNTPKGQDFFDLSKVNYVDSKYEYALRFNHSIKYDVEPHVNRVHFFAQIDEADSVIDLIDKELYMTFKMKMRKKVKYIQNRVNTLLCRMGGGKNDLIACSGNVHNQRIVFITFRKKDIGWKRYRMDISIRI